jgi:hypothetical protein
MAMSYSELKTQITNLLNQYDPTRDPVVFPEQNPAPAPAPVAPLPPKDPSGTTTPPPDTTVPPRTTK